MMDVVLPLNVEVVNLRGRDEEAYEAHIKGSDKKFMLTFQGLMKVIKNRQTIQPKRLEYKP